MVIGSPDLSVQSLGDDPPLPQAVEAVATPKTINSRNAFAQRSQREDASESWRFLFLAGSCVLLHAEVKSAYVMWTWRVGGVLRAFSGLILWVVRFIAKSQEASSSYAAS